MSLRSFLISLSSLLWSATNWSWYVLLIASIRILSQIRGSTLFIRTCCCISHHIICTWGCPSLRWTAARYSIFSIFIFMPFAMSLMWYLTQFSQSSRVFNPASAALSGVKENMLWNTFRCGVEILRTYFCISTVL